ncbi:MAG TPA: two-component regulator propeller domain-containing protein [Thermoanaerobaculia bacterium]|nr:two-component regulator propeller domain-containing protein [Thermoanaerobaculia bacterium]
MRLFLVLLAFASVARAELSFTRLAIPENVPAEMCTALAQDARGFIWIGTQRGLVRFDGTNFRTYDEGYVRALYAARDGRLLVGTYGGGFSVFDPANERFTRYPVSHDRVEAVIEDRQGQMWVGTYEGLDRIDPRSGTTVHFKHDPHDPNSLGADRVRALLIDRAGRLWVGSHDGVQRSRGEGLGFERIAPELHGEFAGKLLEDDRGQIWIGTTDHGAWVYQPATNTLRKIEGLSHFWVYGMTQIAPHELWVATFGGGIDVLDPATLAVVDRIKTDPILPNTIPGDRIGALLRDRSGVVWAGTWGQGIARHDPATRAFRTLRFSPNRPESLTHPAAVRALQMQDGTIWVGTNGNGIDIFDAQLRRIDHRNDLSSGAVTCLAQANDGTIFVATLDGNLHRLAPGAKTFTHLTKSDGLPGGPIRTMAFDADGMLWVGAADGMARVASVITTFHHVRDDARTIASNTVESIVVDRDGTLWIGTDNGLDHFDATHARVLAHFGRGALPNNWVPDLMFARDGRLWVATNGGACVMNGARCEAMTNKPAESLIEDARGRVWIGPRLRIDPRTRHIDEFGPSDGCDFRNFFIASRAITRRGELLFGAPEGLLIVQPQAITAWRFAPPLVVTSLHVDGAERRGAATMRELQLAPRTKGFRVDVASLDFTAPAKNRFRYRLEGFDPRWTHADASQASIAYTNLSPGNYVLRVQGTNRAGVWSPHELRLPVIVLPAFYQTNWFRILVALLIAALIYLAYRLRLRQLHARGRELERLVSVRTAELQQAYHQIEEASLTDPLTQLRNRRFLEQSIARDVDLAVRRNADGATDSDLVFLLVDLDHFKSVNDTYGHAAGDAVLQQTADVLRATFRSSDSIVRWGGEEFLVVARMVERRQGADLAEKLRAAIASHPFVLPDGETLKRTCSIGFASFPFSPADPRAVKWEQVVDLADNALYAAKRSGRDGWVGVEPDGIGDPNAIVQSFRDDPAAAIATRAVRVLSLRPALVWA